MIKKLQKSTSIFFVRHGEVDNPHNVLPGRLPNFHLSLRGKNQAKITGDYLKTQNINYIYASPMERCQTTARIIQKAIARPIQPIQILEDVNEVITAYDGEQLEHIKKYNFDFYSHPYARQGAETIDAVTQRAERAVKFILQTHPGNRIIIVTHGDIIMFLKMKLIWKKSDFRFARGPHYPPPCSIFTLIFNKENQILQSQETIFPQ